MPPSQIRPLLCHPAAICPAAASVVAEIAWTAAGSLSLAYRLQGRLEGLVIPAPQPPGPADGLWEHTCFEAFVAVAGEPAYREYNFSPSGQWAAYGFNSYRQRDEGFRSARGPEISVRPLADGLLLQARLAPELLPFAPPGGLYQVGLSAVVEAADGSRSYWALSHPGPRPDFHQRDAFGLTLALPPSSL